MSDFPGEKDAAIPSGDDADHPERRSPLESLIEAVEEAFDDPKPSDHGIASLDKALWDPSRDKSEVERSAEES